MIVVQRMVLASVLMALATGAQAFTCDQRDHSYLNCVKCPTNDTVSNALKRIGRDCNPCTTKCGSSNPQIVPTATESNSCGQLPPGLNTLLVLDLSSEELERLAEINPYVAITLLYGQLGDSPGDRSPFGGVTSFGASLTTQQAIAGIRNIDTLLQGRSPFDPGYAVVVEDVFELSHDETIERVFRTYYKGSDGSRIAIHSPVALTIRPQSESSDPSIPGVRIVRYGLQSFAVSKGADSET